MVTEASVSWMGIRSSKFCRPCSSLFHPSVAKTWCREKTLSVSNMQRADVAIFVTHCDYMLVTVSMTTSISADEISMCWTVFLSFLLHWKPCILSVSRSSHGDVTFCGNFTRSVLAKSPWDIVADPKISFHLFTFIFPLQSHPDPQTNSDSLCHHIYELQIAKSSVWLSSLGSSRCVWSRLVCHHCLLQDTDKTWPCYDYYLSP